MQNNIDIVAEEDVIEPIEPTYRVDEPCNIWNWEWNPQCVCTECYMG